MKEAVPILVCGNAGPVGGDLLRRRDISIHWALSVPEAIAVLAKVNPPVCIVLEQHAEALLAAKPAEATTRFISLVANPTPESTQKQQELGATLVVQISVAERILEAISELTGLAFAQHPRVLFRSPISIEIPDEETVQLETVNLSASGLCVKGLSPAAQGKSVRVRVHLDAELTSNAIVVRCFEQEGTPMAGLCFTDLSAEEHTRVEKFVERELFHHPESTSTVLALEFGAEIPVVEAPRRPADVAMAELKAHLREVHLESKRDEMLHQPRKSSAPPPMHPAPAKKPFDESKLSAPERASMRGDPAPAWAEPALKARLRLDLDKKERGKLTHDAVHDVLVVCRDMGSSVAESDMAALVEVTTTRAALLKEIYWEPARRRVGTKRA
jgi:hypothetical protein